MLLLEATTKAGGVAVGEVAGPVMLAQLQPLMMLKNVVVAGDDDGQDD